MALFQRKLPLRCQLLRRFHRLLLRWRPPHRCPALPSRWGTCRQRAKPAHPSHQILSYHHLVYIPLRLAPPAESFFFVIPPFQSVEFGKGGEAFGQRGVCVACTQKEDVEPPLVCRHARASRYAWKGGGGCGRHLLLRCRAQASDSHNAEAAAQEAHGMADVGAPEQDTDQAAEDGPTAQHPADKREGRQDNLPASQAKWLMPPRVGVCQHGCHEDVWEWTTGLK